MPLAYGLRQNMPRGLQPEIPPPLLRLEGDAWSNVKRLGQAMQETNDHAPPRPAPCPRGLDIFDLRSRQHNNTLSWVSRLPCE